MKPRLSLFALALLIVLFGVATAQAEEITLDKVIVSARGSESTQSKTPGGTGVVEKEEIVLDSKASIADAIFRISGLSPTGESPWGQDISIRGLTGSSVVILIDGMRVNTATELNARLGFINPMDVERIEVLKGPVSSLYGTGSTGGVVNIITKKGKTTAERDISGEFYAGWSTNPEGPDGYARAAFSDENYWLQLSLGGRDHTDTYGGDSTRMPNSQYEDIYYRLAGAYEFSDKFDMAYQFMKLEAHEVGIPGGSSAMPQTANVTYPRTSNTLVSTDFTYTPSGETIQEVLLNVYYMKNERRVRISDFHPAIKAVRPEADHETLGTKLQAKGESGDHSYIFGADAWKWHMFSWRTRHLASGAEIVDKPTPNSTQYSTGIFAEDDWKLNETFTLNLGGRFDRVQVKNEEHPEYDAGNEVDYGWNLHAGLTWSPDETWSHTFIAATSYRVADILERFKNISLGGDTYRGNPDLDPEKSYFLEYGLHYNTGTLSAKASLFANFLTDYMEDRLYAANTYRVENIGEARIFGLELDADWRFATAWNLYGNLAVTDGRDEENDVALRSVAPVNGLAGLKYTDESGFWARMETPWALRQSETPTDVDMTDGYFLVDLAGGYSMDWKETRHEFSLTLNNIFDTKYKNYLANSRSVEILGTGFSAGLNYHLHF